MAARGEDGSSREDGRAAEGLLLLVPFLGGAVEEADVVCWKKCISIFNLRFPSTNRNKRNIDNGRLSGSDN